MNFAPFTFNYGGFKSKDYGIRFGHFDTEEPKVLGGDYAHTMYYINNAHRRIVPTFQQTEKECLEFDIEMMAPDGISEEQEPSIFRALFNAPRFKKLVVNKGVNCNEDPEGTLQTFNRKTSYNNGIQGDGTGVIQSIHGKTLAFNQLVDGIFPNLDKWTVNTDYATGSVADNKLTLTVTNSNVNESVYTKGTNKPNIKQGHQYLISFIITNSESGEAFVSFNHTYPLNSMGTVQANTRTRFTKILTANADGNYPFYIYPSRTSVLPVGATSVIENVMVIDLTQMFGAGNEPTIEEFEALFPEPYYPYNAGELINFMGMKSAGSVYDELTPDKAVTRIGSRAYASGDENDNTLVTDGTTTYYPLATPTETPISPPLNLSYKVADFGTETVDDGNLITDGFNQWDEEWELGTLDGNTGAKINNNNRIRSKNFIKVFPNTAYYNCGHTLSIFEYDTNMQFIKYTDVTQRIFTVSPSTYYLMFTLNGTTYNHDICINLSWSGYRNGEYEPYWKRTLDLCVDDYFTDDNPDNMPYAPFNAVIKYTEDIFNPKYMMCIFNEPQRIQVPMDGAIKTIGYKCTAVLDSAWQWEDKEIEITPASTNTINIPTMFLDYVNPKVTIYVGTSGGEIAITNNTDRNRLTKFENIAPNTTIIMEPDYCKLTYTGAGNIWSKFKMRHFLRLLPNVDNTLTITGDVTKIIIEYKEAHIL